MTTREEHLKEFHEAMDMAHNKGLSTELLEFRMSLIIEEVNELEEAARDIIECIIRGEPIAASFQTALLKELADVQYVVSGFADSIGLPLDAAFHRVHWSNMSKLVDGKPLKREDGKVLKGPNYTPPDLTDLV